MKAFHKNQEAERILNDMLGYWGDRIDKLRGKRCYAYFYSNGELGGIDEYEAPIKDVVRNQIILDLNDMARSMRQLCMVQLYNNGFHGKDLTEFDVSTERKPPVDWTKEGSVYGEATKDAKLLKETAIENAKEYLVYNKPGYIDHDFGSILTDEPVKKPVVVAEKKCECGGEKAITGHSFWCPKYA